MVFSVAALRRRWADGDVTRRSSASNGVKLPSSKATHQTRNAGTIDATKGKVKVQWKLRENAAWAEESDDDKNKALLPDADGLNHFEWGFVKAGHTRALFLGMDEKTLPKEEEEDSACPWKSVNRRGLIGSALTSSVVCCWWWFPSFVFVRSGSERGEDRRPPRKHSGNTNEEEGMCAPIDTFACNTKCRTRFRALMQAPFSLYNCDATLSRGAGCLGTRA